MNLTELISICISGAWCIVSILLGLIIRHKSKSGKVDVSELDKLKATQDLIAKIPATIVKSETIFKGGNGAGKLAWCINSLMVDAVRNNVDITEEELTTKIEEILETPQKKQAIKIN